MAAVQGFPPPSPSSSAYKFPRSHSPTKEDLRPNAHPYPIKTTSTAVLSRSNSVSSSPATKHHYIPISPSPKREASADSSDDKRKKDDYRGHRYSRSLSTSEDQHVLPAQQGPRALPVPPNVTNNSIAAINAAAKANELVVSPKRWTPEELAAHLGQSVSKEAGEWAARSRIGGRAFMKMREEELEALGAPPSLQPAARALRQEVLQAQFESTSPISSSESGSEFEFGRRNTSPTRLSPTRSAPLASPTRLSPATYEVEEPPSSEDEGTPQHRAGKKQSPHIRASAVPFMSEPQPLGSPTSPFVASRSGRVRGMVRSFERSGSESDGSGISPERGGSTFRPRPRTHSAASSSAGSSQSDSRASVLSNRPLPVRPDGIDIDLNLGATVRAAPVMGVPPTVSEEELSMEELLARHPDSATNTPQGTPGTWRKRKAKGRRWGDEPETDAQPISAQSTGRPLPPRPDQMPTKRGGVHAWEDEDGAAGMTVKRVVNGPPVVRDVFDGSPLVAIEPTDTEPTNGEPVNAEEPANTELRIARVKAECDAAADRGRTRGLAVRTQLEEAAKLRGLVDVFRMRLEEVERRVAQMEANEETRKRKEEDALKLSTRKIEQRDEPKATTLIQRLDPRRILSLFSVVDDPRKDVGPTTIIGLPSYVLLVGIGVCAVVLRVLVKKGLRR
ncbi:unnamed protein product [Mycena citricolor]|uniref:Uncharacterized protein n=1 Tax=Mycena citricolor TaxID=2018698 RepID=A0AAD2HR96_9AGAR|nr:unnamed protein product [Mycena citricolor]